MCHRSRKSNVHLLRLIQGRFTLHIKAGPVGAESVATLTRAARANFLKPASSKARTAKSSISQSYRRGKRFGDLVINMNTTTNTLKPDLLHKMDAYWRAANYLSVGQIYLYDNPLLKRPLKLADIKHMLLGHWGTTPGQNFIYVHLNRVIKKGSSGFLVAAEGKTGEDGGNE